MPTVSETAKTLNLPLGRFLELCRRAGLPQTSGADPVGEEDKKALLRLMQSGGARVKLVRETGPAAPVEVPRAGGGRGQARVKVKRKGRYRMVPARDSAPEPEAKAEPAPAEPEAKAEAKPAKSAETPARKPAPRKGKPRGKGADGRRQPERAGRRGRLEIRDRASVRKPRGRKRPAKVVVDNKHGFTEPTERIVREVVLHDAMTVADLAKALAVKASEVVRALLDLGEIAAINDTLSPDVAELVTETMGHKVQRRRAENAETELLVDAAPAGEPVPRAPVVAVMGHVDHGKTSLLDYIRKTRVASGEAGGITQHIGAYQVGTGRGGITFLDTPGHAAFASMRARGARCTDLVVLVVAADDGVMPQTEEAVRHAQEAQVPLIVAVSKMDLEGADLKKVQTGLAALGVQPEDWGGDTLFVPLSAKTGDGVDALLEAISLQAGLLELRAPAEGMANGVVIESSLDRGRGATVTVLVQAGRLRRRDLALCGKEYGRVRAMFDEQGREVREAGPSTPVLVLGLGGVPQAGDPVHGMPSEQKAQEVAALRRQKGRAAAPARGGAAAWLARLGEEKKTLNLVVKADVRGSAEALREALEGLGTEQVGVKVVRAGVGGVTESDAALADTAQAMLIGFNVRADNLVRGVIADRGLDLRYYNVIYELIDDVRKLLEERLEPEIREEITGLAQVLEVFRSSRIGQVAGCRVVEGAVRRGQPIRVLRDSVVVFEGSLESLRRHKDDVAEVPTGAECGIAVADYEDVQVGDQIEVYRRVEIARTL